MKPEKKSELKKSKLQPTSTKDIIDFIDNYFEKKQKTWFWILFFISVIFTFLLFDLRVSVGGDDSEYIIRADNFIKDFRYPSFQGPLYPIVLSIVIWIFGINLPILKLVSAIFLAVQLYFTFAAFKNRIPSSILIFTLLLISINSNLLFYGSQTYSEAFFLMAQMLFFIFFFKHFVENKQIVDYKKEIINCFFLGSIILSLGLIKSIGFAALFVVIVFLAVEKRWKSLSLSIAGFGLSFGIWQTLKFLLWNDSKAQFSDQAATLFQKHPYDASKGLETIGGFIQRFIDNSNIYLSRQLFEIFGLRPELVQQGDSIGAPPVIPLLTILVYFLFIYAIIWNFKKNKYLLFTGIYLSVILGVTFIILQTLWESKRLIISVYPFMVMFILAGTYSFLKHKRLKNFQLLYPIIVIVLFFSTLGTSISNIKEHQKIFKSHLQGNITAGMTPDWVNFINMSKWAADNIPQDKIIASRKPSISFIYTGRRFFGIYKVETTDPDSLLNYLHEQKVEYVIMASLRKIEAQKTEQIINTIQRYLGYIQQKYPDKIKLVQQIGDDEPAYLFKIE